MMKNLSFKQSKSIIENASKNGSKLQLNSMPVEMSYYWNGTVRSKIVTGFFVSVNDQLIYDLPGEQIPPEFIECGSWERDNNITHLLSQFAAEIQKGTKERMDFELNSSNRFQSRMGVVKKVLIVNYGLTDLLYKHTTY